jgi:peroxiredoxin
MPVRIGQQAPEFQLYNTLKEPVSLGDLKGKKVVLLFFPLAFTPTCTKELCYARDNLARYNSLNATVFGISGDSVYSLAKFKLEQALNFDLLSDFNHEAATAYDCLYPVFGAMKMYNVCKRASFVIDEAGKLRFAEVLENATDLPDFAGLEKYL